MWIWQNLVSNKRRSSGQNPKCMRNIRCRSYFKLKAVVQNSYMVEEFRFTQNIPLVQDMYIQSR